MESIAIYSANTSNRFVYVLDWLLKERMRINYTLTSKQDDVAGLPICLAYGAQLPNAISIPDAGLLWEKGTGRPEPATATWQDLPVLYPGTEEGYTLPFDIFSGVFYLLSRYEEYQPHAADRHGRYPAAECLLHRKGWLLRPLADEWTTALRKTMQAAAPQMQIDAPHFHFQPTYDIDMAYSHLYKGFGRIFGAYMRALLRGDVRQINERTKVLKYKQKDPYDSFRWLRQLHKEYDCKPVYFVLASQRTTRYDKNISPQHPAMMRIIRNLAREGAIGMHPSYYSGLGDTMLREKGALEQVAGRGLDASRQHYIKLRVPETCRALLRLGITDDYSMGYGSHLGFRAGTGSSFRWYDMGAEEVTGLRMHPFCFMDTTAHFEAKMPVTEAFGKLEAMSKLLEKTGSTLVTVFHNFSLGTASEWKGWRQAYEHFLAEKSRT